MSNILKRNSSIQITVAASDKLAVYSQSAATVKKLTGYPNFPDSETLVKLTVAGTEWVSSAFTLATEVIIEAGNNDVYYNAGTAPVITERQALRGQGTPGALNATGALTAAMILSGLVTTTVAAAVTATLPTGAVLDAAVEMEIGESFDWSVLSHTGANTFTVTAAASGHTVLGTMAVATVTSGVFRTRKTAAATYVTYRVG
jgi:hypothetical protein